MSNLHIFSRLALAAGILALTACTQDVDIVGQIPYHQPLRIATAAAPLGINPDFEKQEMINNYTLLFVNTDGEGRVEAIQNYDKGGETVEYDVVSFPIEISRNIDGVKDLHPYEVYAFANFTDEMKQNVKIGNYTLANLTVGMKFDYELEETTLDLTALNGHDFKTAGDYIPMTAVVDYDATMQYHQPVNVPLVRMLAKLDFRITNKTGGSIKIDKITMRPIYNMPVYLLPHIEGMGVGKYPERPASAEEMAKRYIPQVPKAPDPAKASDTIAVTLNCAGTDKIDHEGTATFASMYVNESLAKWHPTKQFAYDVVLTDADGQKRQYRYALSEDDFTAFLRNDHVTIPLVITSDYSIEPEVIFYPPIGGYPPVIADKKDHEFYATFRTGGEFAIYPHIYKDSERTDIRLTDIDKVEFSVAKDGHNDDKGVACTTEHLTVTGDAIFSKAPKYVAADNCIIGTLSGETGHAVITLTVKMIDSQTIVHKKMHIIRE